MLHSVAFRSIRVSMRPPEVLPCSADLTTTDYQYARPLSAMRDPSGEQLSNLARFIKHWGGDLTLI